VNEARPWRLTARTASDADGDALSYLWNFGDSALAAEYRPTHVYADDGSYTVTLTVNDGQGSSSSVSLVVTVTNVAPAATLSGAKRVEQASTYT
jgi:PKD repeat protein